MSNAEEVKLSLKVIINKEKTKVLCALLDNNLADILLSFLTLPLGRIIHLFKKHYGDDDEAPNIGSLSTLYKGLVNLDSSHFCTKAGKLMLLNPKSSLQDECGKLKINLNDTQTTTIYYTCGNLNCRQSVVSMYYGTKRCVCGKLMNREIEVRGSVNEDNDYGDGEVFTSKSMSFLITDDLQMLLNGTRSIKEGINELGIMDVDTAEHMTVTIGFNEIMDLLKGSLFSRTPLSDLILHKSQINHHSATSKSVPSELSTKMNKGSTTRSKRIKVKATVQKSNNKLLFVQAGEDFVDFLFSLLTIPLGEVERLLDSDTSLGKMDNFYKSIANLNGDRYLKSQRTKDKLLNPELPPKFLPNNQVFSLTEQNTPKLYYYKKTENKKKYIEYLSPTKEPSGLPVSIKDPKGFGSYVKGSRMYMVTDDLTVTPLCFISTLSTLKELRITMSDVEELELDIGSQECLSILKASLTSTSVLSNGLSPILNKKEQFIKNMQVMGTRTRTETIRGQFNLFPRISKKKNFSRIREEFEDIDWVDNLKNIA